MADPESLPPEVLERLRRGVPLRMTRSGAFTFGGEPVTHPRVIAALRAGLDSSEAGEPIVHLGDPWCYLTVEDTPLRATSLRRDGDRLEVALDDGRIVEIDPSTLREEPDLGVRGEVPSARSGRPLAVRFTNRAQMDLANWIAWKDERPYLELSGNAWPLHREL